MPRGVYERKPKAQPAPEPEVPNKPPEQTAEELAAAKEKAVKANSERNMTRVEMMNAIADNNDQLRDPDMEETDGAVVFKDEAQEAEDQAQREAEAAEQALAEAQAKGLQEEGAAPAQEGDEKEVNGTKYYLTIVNGKEKWLTLAQLRETAQKVDSADEYLRAASESVKQMAGQALSKQDEPAELDEEQLRKTLSAAVLGDEEAIKLLASRLVRPSATDIGPQIDRRVSFMTELKQLEAEQAEVLNHPYLGKLFQSRLAELKAEAPTTPLATAYRSIGKELRDAFPEKFKKTAAIPLADKEARKRSLPAPVQSAGRQQQVTEEEEDESVESVIAQMAKARGQPAPVVHGRGSTSNFQRPEKG